MSCHKLEEQVSTYLHDTTNQSLIQVHEVNVIIYVFIGRIVGIEYFSIINEDIQLSVRHKLIDEHLNANQFSHLSAVVGMHAHDEGKRPQNIGTNKLHKKKREA